jgi:hypothetical protein
VKFALGVVVVDQQRKTGRAGGLCPFQHLPVTPGVAGGQDRPAAHMTRESTPVGEILYRWTTDPDRFTEVAGTLAAVVSEYADSTERGWADIADQ